MLKNDYAVLLDGTTVVYVDSRTHGLHLVLMDWVDFDGLEGRVGVAVGPNWGPYAHWSNGHDHTSRLHRVLLPAPPGMQTDHIDRDGLNNRRINLRLATPSQNQANRRMRADNTSGYIGVTWDQRKSKWRAQIKSGGKLRVFGLFEDPSEAARVRDRWALEMYGEFATLNYPAAP